MVNILLTIFMKKNVTQAHIGVLGLGTMGASLARNIESRGFVVALHNRSKDRADAFMSAYGEGNFINAQSIKTFAASLKRPRSIILMVTAGTAVDASLKAILPHLEKGDIIIDGGNSFYRDTEKRYVELKEKGIHFLGCGISGGEEGALSGPSLMVGGSKQGWNSVKKIFFAIAAKDKKGNPCASYLGDSGAGHYVKMVHNGIEYGIMQIIAECYALLRDAYELPAPAIAEIFDACNQGVMKSFLLDTAITVLQKKDDQKKTGYLIDMIFDKAGQKGTGAWTSIDALNRGVAIPTITEAVFARAASAAIPLRTILSKNKRISDDIAMTVDIEDVANMLGDALRAGTISTFAQGCDLILQASREEKWGISMSEVTRVWQAGCIIRMNLLSQLSQDFEKKFDIHIMQMSRMQNMLAQSDAGLRLIANVCLAKGVAAPALLSSVSYIDTMTTKNGSANMIQGLRDAFGAHTYERRDRPGIFHSEW